MKKIVITNAYGYKNIGDGAILDSAINIINKAIDKSTIDIHTATHFTVKANKENSPRTLLHPYGIAIKTKDNPISDSLKLVRFSQVVLISLFYAMIGKIFPNILPNGDYSYIRSIKEADIVFGIGGGYFRTKNKYKDYFGLLLTLLPIFIAHIYNKRLLYLPMSYGNFASALQDKIVFNLIKNDSIILRDEIRLRAYQKNSSKKLDTHLIPDLALFDDHNTPKGRRENYIVLTARLWMDKTRQENYETDLALYVDYMWKKYKLRTIFIPMVWNKTEEDDERVAKRISALVKNKQSFQIRRVSTPNEVKSILSHARMAICTRMHSAILSSIVRTPFITIAYEHKTQGFMRHFRLEKWNIDIRKVSFSNLKNLSNDLLRINLAKVESHFEEVHSEIRAQENKLINIIKSFSLRT